MDKVTQYIDAKSFKELFRTYGPKVYAVCLHHIRERETARDPIQDIFRSIWERRNQLKIHGAIGHYLLKAAKLKVLEYFRKVIASRKNVEGFRVIFFEGDSSPFNRSELKYLLDFTQKELQLMSDKTCEIFRLCRKKPYLNLLPLR